VCLLAAIIRTVPFVSKGDDSIHPIIKRVLNDDPPDVREAGVEDDLAAVIGDLLRKRPEERPNDAASVMARFDAIRIGHRTVTSGAARPAVVESSQTPADEPPLQGLPEVPSSLSVPVAAADASTKPPSALDADFDVVSDADAVEQIGADAVFENDLDVAAGAPVEGDIGLDQAGDLGTYPVDELGHDLGDMANGDVFADPGRGFDPGPNDGFGPGPEWGSVSGEYPPSAFDGAAPFDPGARASAGAGFGSTSAEFPAADYRNSYDHLDLDDPYSHGATDSRDWSPSADLREARGGEPTEPGRALQLFALSYLATLVVGGLLLLVVFGLF
jgi:hypothetical protein